jgi:hypothetical protein
MLCLLEHDALHYGIVRRNAWTTYLWTVGLWPASEVCSSLLRSSHLPLLQRAVPFASSSSYYQNEKLSHLLAWGGRRLSTEQITAAAVRSADQIVILGRPMRPMHRATRRPLLVPSFGGLSTRRTRPCVDSAARFLNYLWVRVRVARSPARASIV